MFKLKIINKPKMIKMKCNIEFPDVVLANLQEKEVTPTKETQEIKADQQYDGLSKVVVNAIPSEYIIPSGEIEITANGNYNVTDKASAKVNVPEKKLGTKTITDNGTYNATDDNVDGYSQVTVETSGVDINDYYDLTKRKSGNFISYIKQIPLIDTSDYTSMGYMFSSFTSLTTIPLLNTSKVTNMNSMFYSCLSLTTIPLLDTNKVTNMSNIVYNCRYLENLGGFENLGMAYEISQSANYSNYTLNLSGSNNLTHESLMNIINNLYDIKTKGCNAQKLILGTTNINKLTSEEIALATSRGWNVS